MPKVTRAAQRPPWERPSATPGRLSAPPWASNNPWNSDPSGASPATSQAPPALTVRPHWLYACKAFVFWLFCVGAAVAALILLPSRHRPSWLGLAAAAVCILPGLLFAWRLLYRNRMRLSVTINGVHLRQGVLRKQEQVIPLPRIDDVQATQHLLQRMCGLGDIHIISGSGSSEETFGWAPHPHQLASELLEWINVRYTHGITSAVRN